MNVIVSMENIVAHRRENVHFLRGPVYMKKNTRMMTAAHAQREISVWTVIHVGLMAYVLPPNVDGDFLLDRDKNHVPVTSLEIKLTTVQREHFVTTHRHQQTDNQLAASRSVSSTAISLAHWKIPIYVCATMSFAPQDSTVMVSIVFVLTCQTRFAVMMTVYAQMMRRVYVWILRVITKYVIKINFAIVQHH